MGSRSMTQASHRGEGQDSAAVEGPGEEDEEEEVEDGEEPPPPS